MFLCSQTLFTPGIDSTGITYKDNGNVLDMILSKPMGFFALLDEECRFPRASTETLVRKEHNRRGKERQRMEKEKREGGC